MIVNPGIRRFLGSAIQRLFNSASFYAPLTHSLALERGTGSPTFTRPSTATVEGYGPTDNAVDGLKLLTVAANEARFVGARRISEGVWSNTFADGSLIPAATNTGYLAEGARTNLCLQSNAFTTTWAQIGTLTPVQNVAGPDGSTSAWTFTDDNAAATEARYQAITLTAATHTFSVFVKKTTGAQSSYPVIQTTDLGTNIALCTVDTTNGVATVWTAYTGFTIVTSSATCVSYNTDYWRVSLTFLPTAAAWYHYLQPAATANATQSTGVPDVTAQGSAVFYGAQVELGASASSYIPTTTAAVTRAADVLTYPSAGNVDGTKGWCYAEVNSYPFDTTANHYVIADSAANRTPLYVNSANRVANFDGTNSNTQLVDAVNTGAVAKIASSWGGAEINSAVRGVVGTATAFDGDFNFGSAIMIGNAGVTAGVEFFGTIRNLRIGQRQLSASELQAITAP